MQFLDPVAVMHRALELAARGVGRVEPNPAVGAVIVDDDLHLLGEGYHQQYGGPHAEVHALGAAGERARGATLYCTLEPCAHWGQTPPCADAIIAAGVRRVIVAMRDPAPHVDGRGIARLQAAGIPVETGLLESEAQQLAAPFVTLMTRNRPYVHAKWAMSLDGRIATHSGRSQWISNAASRDHVHELRGRMDAILVGSGTVLADDPLLTARPPGPRTATRIVLDGRGRMPSDCQLARTQDAAPLLVITTSVSTSEWRDALAARGAEVLVLPIDRATSRVDLRALMTELARRRMTNLLVEGGSAVLGAFFDAGLVDECHVFVAARIIGGAGAPGAVGGVGHAEVPPPILILQREFLDGDVYIRGRVTRSESCPDDPAVVPSTESASGQ